MDKLAIGLFGEDELRESGDQQGIQNSQQDRCRDRHEYSGNQILLHGICNFNACTYWLGGSIPVFFSSSIANYKSQIANSYTSLMPVMNMSISLMPMNGTTKPPNPYTSKFCRKSDSALIALYLTPRNASGIRATMMSALKMTAESIADCGV